MKLGDEPVKANVDVIPTGCLSLDIALGVGGIPRGRIIEIFGPESSGKTTIALHLVAEVQKMGGLAGYIDAEHALDPIYAKNLGVDTNNIYLSQPDDGEQALEIAEKNHIKVQQGVYVGTQGPTFETPAEYRYFHIIGGDAVGMSTVPEVIVARHAGIEVFAVSVITDLGVEGIVEKCSHEEVQKAAAEAQPRMSFIMKELVEQF